ncbi:hypothetical protein [Lapillicoccus jejuensis]|uniref:GDSL-like lipase/acylhydrolase family protein n=1 Tax=Lapillicoccus jejuensis TaxID=402171 RepID=A0A542DZ73_9MICO|nr:hypothetical protein [Lapillicoccus jejuensis]TQJ08387.1 hypothetical protein FB458_1475 [Lapillicoccus jejuensis]
MPPTRRRTAPVLGLLALLAALVTPVLAAPAARADGPGAGSPWVVTLGDSFISGEAGRWAGSSNASSTRADALGPTAYFDNATHTAETTPRCHRSASAEAYIGAGVQGLDLACSGATTSTSTASDGSFKPGLDFADDGAGHVGQAKTLQTFAASHDVKLVVVSIGGNDFGFASIIQQCVTDFLTSPSWWPDYCRDDASVTAHFTAANVAAVRAAVAGALRNVRTAMRGAGYGDAQWRLLVQTYPSPLPSSGGNRYSQSGYTRQSTGGCGFWDADLTWANGTALTTIDATVRGALADSGVTNSALLELAHTLDGRRLCERGVGLYEEVGLASWQSPGAVDRTEWVNQIRTVSTVTGPYYVQESLHPNYWAQLGYRSCLRQAWNGGAVRGGTCTRTGSGLTSLGEPVMTLQ